LEFGRGFGRENWSRSALRFSENKVHIRDRGVLKTRAVFEEGGEKSEQIVDLDCEFAKKYEIGLQAFFCEHIYRNT